jgi:hypothetical protein
MLHADAGHVITQEGRLQITNDRMTAGMWPTCWVSKHNANHATSNGRNSKKLANGVACGHMRRWYNRKITASLAMHSADAELEMASNWSLGRRS